MNFDWDEFEESMKMMEKAITEFIDAVLEIVQELVEMVIKALTPLVSVLLLYLAFMNFEMMSPGVYRGFFVSSFPWICYEGKLILFL